MTSRKLYSCSILILALNSEKHLEIATIDKFQLDMKNNDGDIRQLNADIVPTKSMYFVAGSKRLDAVVCMARFPSSNGRISSHFDCFRLKLSTRLFYGALSPVADREVDPWVFSGKGNLLIAGREDFTSPMFLKLQESW